MKYFIDFEFLEGDVPCQIKGFNIPRWLIKPNNTIQPISVGICSSDGREYYAISKDFNLKEAWNRYDEIKNGFRDFGMTPNYNKVYWIRYNVLKPIFIELRAKEVEEYNIAQRRNVVLDFPEYSFCFIEFKRLINKYGKTNKQIAEEIKDFISYKQFYKDTCQINLYQDSFYDLRIEDLKQRNMLPQFYGYYCDYDWVVLCWLFGRMIDLPKGFPMFAFDLKQELDNKVNNLNWLYLRDTWNNSRMSIYTIGKGDGQKKDRLATFEEKLKRIKELDEYPKQTNEHNALSDALFCKELYYFLNSL